MTQQTSIGLIAAPELPEKLATDLVKMLPKTMTKYISRETEWTVEMVVDPLTGGAESVEEIFTEAADYRKTKGWDYIISLTDLPIFHDKHIVAVDVDEENGCGLISIPAFGWMPILKRVQKSIVQIVQQISDVSDFSKAKSSKGLAEPEDQVLHAWLLKKQFPIAPVRKIRTWLNETKNVHTRFLLIPRLNGSLRLLSGMTFANNPFKLMSSLTTVVAIAFTTGAFGLIFTTMWQLSYLFSNWRLTGVTIAAIVGMTLWVIIAHDLWEPGSSRNYARIRRLYNLTTVLTLLIAIVIYYAILFMLFLSMALVFIPPDFLTETLSIDTSAGIVEYLQIAWFASSISTVAGAIGAGLENEAFVRDVTYGYRQKRRYQEIRQNNS